jgi:DNA-directed RNA polymerase specialized sigma24 family protein
MAEEPQQPRKLDQVSTRWSAVNDPAFFMLRYATAVRAYFGAILTDFHDAEEAFQKFCLRVVEKGFAGADPERGRFRDYLKQAVRNFALNYRRDQTRPPAAVDPGELPVTPDLDGRWLAEWRRLLLDRAWRALEVQQAGEHYATVLRLAAEFPDETSQQLAERAARLIGRPLRADAYRQQLSRARRLLAALLRYEVGQTLENATPESVEEELVETGLMGYLRGLLDEPPGGKSEIRNPKSEIRNKFK